MQNPDFYDKVNFRGQLSLEAQYYFFQDTDNNALILDHTLDRMADLKPS